MEEILHHHTNLKSNDKFLWMITAPLEFVSFLFYILICFCSITLQEVIFYDSVSLIIWERWFQIHHKLDKTVWWELKSIGYDSVAAIMFRKMIDGFQITASKKEMHQTSWSFFLLPLDSIWKRLSMKNNLETHTKNKSTKIKLTWVNKTRNFSIP